MRKDLKSAEPKGLPETFCLWAAEQRDLTRSNIKHLVRRIRKGNWASLRIPQRSALRCID